MIYDTSAFFSSTYSTRKSTLHSFRRLYMGISFDWSLISSAKVNKITPRVVFQKKSKSYLIFEHHKIRKMEWMGQFSPPSTSILREKPKLFNKRPGSWVSAKISHLVGYGTNPFSQHSSSSQGVVIQEIESYSILKILQL